MVRLRKHSRGNDSKDTPGKYPAYKEREVSMRLKWLSILINILAIALITASLFVLLVVVSTPAGQVPQVMGFSILRVMSVSMEPEIPEQSMLLVHKTDPDALQVGDVITFFSSDPTLNGTLNTHRIIRIDRQRTGLQFVTKGDANALADRQDVKGSQVVRQGHPGLPPAGQAGGAGLHAAGLWSADPAAPAVSAGAQPDRHPAAACSAKGGFRAAGTGGYPIRQHRQRQS